MKKIKLPKLHLACGSLIYRPIFDHILITKDDIVATDTNIMAILKTSDVFSNEFIEAMPPRFLIHKSQWKSFYNKTLIFSFENNMIVSIRDGYKVSYNIIIENDQLKFPDYKFIIPKKQESTKLDFIGFNPFLLKTLSSAIINSGAANKCLKLSFFGEQEAILITPNDTNNNSIGIIMPVVVSN